MFVGTKVSEKAIQTIETALEQTSRSAEDSDGLARQINLLNNALQVPEASSFVKERASETTLKAVSTFGKTLREASKVRSIRRGTPEHTELLNLLDGIIIRLVRQAREASIQASKEFGLPAIAQVFTLDKLYI